MTIFFDIETGPLPETELAAQFAERWQPPSPPGEFDPASVKYGNTKDKDKRAEKLADAQQAHAAAVARYAETVEQAKAEKWSEYVGGAALSPITGRVLAIGMFDVPGNRKVLGSVHSLPEDELLEKWWEKATSQIKAGRLLVGHSIFGFDLPFLVQRSWILGVEVPTIIRKSSRYWADQFIDTRELWQCGDRQCKSSLDHIARALGVGGKPDDITGADFARLFWSEVEADRVKAFEYLANDLDMTRAIANRMGIV
jgi:hypothetical protein